MSKFLFYLGTAFPAGYNWEDWTKSWANWATGNGDNVGKFMSPGTDKAIDFYLSNSDYLRDQAEVGSMIWGTLQNGIYTALWGLSQVATMLISGVIYLFKLIPDALTDKSSPLHVILIGMIGLAVAIMGVAGGIYIIEYLRGSKKSMTAMIGNAFFSVGLLLATPLIAVFIGNTITKYVAPNVSNPTELALQPLKENTVDMYAWALDGFSSQPFSPKAPMYNSIGEGGSKMLPNFADTIDNADISQINALAKENGNVAIYNKSNSTEKVGDVFNYHIGDGTKPSDRSKPEYTIVDSKLTSGSGIMKMTGESYKRYRVRNLPAITTYLILILFSVLFSVKLGRTAAENIGNLIASPIAVAKSFVSSQEAKNVIVSQINSALTVVVDIVLLYLFVEYGGTLPSAASDNIAKAGVVGAAAAPFVYIIVFGLVAWSVYNGSSLVERSFGTESGLNENRGLFSMLTTPGAMIGAGMIQRARDFKQSRDISSIKKAMSDNPNPSNGSDGNGGLQNDGTNQKNDVLNEQNDNDQSNHAMSSQGDQANQTVLNDGDNQDQIQSNHQDSTNDQSQMTNNGQDNTMDDSTGDQNMLDNSLSKLDEDKNNGAQARDAVLDERQTSNDQRDDDFDDAKQTELDLGSSKQLQNDNGLNADSGPYSEQELSNQQQSLNDTSNPTDMAEHSHDLNNLPGGNGFENKDDDSRATLRNDKAEVGSPSAKSSNFVDRRSVFSGANRQMPNDPYGRNNSGLQDTGQPDTDGRPMNNKNADLQKRLADVQQRYAQRQSIHKQHQGQRRRNMASDLRSSEGKYIQKKPINNSGNGEVD